MDPVAGERKAWNKRQKTFRDLLRGGENHEGAMALFIEHHGTLHAGRLNDGLFFSFEDEVFRGLDDELARRIPRNKVHSIAWCIWHIARIEDITMNILVAGADQVFQQENWQDRLKIPFLHTGNGMEEHQVAAISAAMDIEALRAYRLAVGRRTQAIVRALTLEEIKRKVDPGRLQRLLDEEAVLEEARDLLAYWGTRTIGGLLLMPATRHNLVHLNEALVLKSRRV